MKNKEEILNKNLVNVIRESRKLLNVHKDLKVSEWVEENIVLSQAHSFIAGKYKNINAPHLVEIMDTLNDSSIKQVVITGSAQIGKTSCMLNMIAYLIAERTRRTSMMIMYPTTESATRFSKNKLEEMIEGCKVVQNKLAKKKSRDSNNTLLSKKIIGGGIIDIVSAGSVSALVGTSKGILIADEIDSITLEGDASQGDAISKLLARGETFRNRYAMFISTPTLTGTSRIHNMYNESYRKKYYCKCVHCNDYTLLLEKNIDYDSESVACTKCGAFINESNRIWGLRNGKWIPDENNNAFNGTVGYWINALSSTLSSIKNVIFRIKEAEGDEDKQEVLYNTVFGLPYSPKRGEDIELEHIQSRKYSYIINNKIPNQVKFITSAIDVQGDRVEILVTGWGKQNHRYILNYKKIYGKIEEYELQQKIIEELSKEYIRYDDIKLKIHSTFIDSGYNTHNVYNFVKRARQTANININAIKGIRKDNTDIFTAIFNNEHQINLIHINTLISKNILFYDLFHADTTDKDNYTHFDSEICDDAFFRQLSSETIVEKMVNGVKRINYIKKNTSRANEIIDLLVYNYAAFKHNARNYDWDTIELNLQKQKNNTEVKQIENNSTDIENRRYEQKRKFSELSRTFNYNIL